MMNRGRIELICLKALRSGRRRERNSDSSGRGGDPYGPTGLRTIFPPRLSQNGERVFCLLRVNRAAELTECYS